MNRRLQVRVALLAFLGMVVSAPSLISAEPLLLEPISREFGWGRATISFAFLTMSPMLALAYFVSGRVMDKFGARNVLIPGYVLCGLSLVLLTQLNGSVFQLLCLKFVSALCATLPTGVAFGNIISRHFRDNRGTVLGLCLGAGGGLGMALVPLFGAWLLAHGGWRATYLGVGALAIVIGFPVALALPSDAKGARPLTAGPIQAIPGLDAKIAFRSLTYQILIAMTFLSCLVIGGIAAHMAAIMTDAGLSTAMAAAALTIFAAMMMVGQFGIGILLDKLRTPRVILPIFPMVLCGVAALQISKTEFGLFAGAALIGLGAGSEYGFVPYFITRFFGLRAFSSLYGALYAIAVLGAGVGPYAMGRAFDATGSYSDSLLIFEFVILLCAALLMFLPPYRYASDGSEIDLGYRNGIPSTQTQ